MKKVLLAASLLLTLAPAARAQNYNIAVRATPPTLTDKTNSPSLFEAPAGGGLYTTLIDPTSGLAFGTSGNPIYTTASGSGGSTAITYAAPATPVSVTTASTLILAAAAYTHSLTLCTLPAATGNIWLNLAGGAAVASVGMYIPAAGGCVNISPPTAAVYGISDSGTVTVTIQGG